MAAAGGRFVTTTRAALEETAKRLEQVDTREKVCRKLRERKLGNTQTSIVFGFDAPEYETDAMSRQKVVIPIAESSRIDCKEMKKVLTSTHFVLGNHELDYGTEGRQIDPTGRTGEFACRAQFDDPRKSSCFLGSHEIEYQTTAHESSKASALASTQQSNNETRATAKKFKAQLSGHNFTLGEETPAYETTSHAAFKYDSVTAQAARGKVVEDQIHELRRMHFDLGAEPTLYETDTQSSMRCGEITYKRLEEMKQDAEAARLLKQKLLATSVVVGDDPAYMK